MHYIHCIYNIHTCITYIHYIHTSACMYAAQLPSLLQFNWHHNKRQILPNGDSLSLFLRPPPSHEKVHLCLRWVSSWRWPRHTQRHDDGIQKHYPRSLILMNCTHGSLTFSRMRVWWMSVARTAQDTSVASYQSEVPSMVNIKCTNSLPRWGYSCGPRWVQTPNPAKGSCYVSMTTVTLCLQLLCLTSMPTKYTTNRVRWFLGGCGKHVEHWVKTSGTESNLLSLDVFVCGS